MAWILLTAAGLLEIGFAICLKLSDGMSKLVPTVSFAFFAVLSFVALTQAMRTIPLGTAYAVWTGIGAAGTAVVGILWLGDPATAARIFFLGLLVVSIVGLQWVSAA